MSKFLTLEHIERICFTYAQVHLTHDEPLPFFRTRFPGKLESVLGASQRTYDRKFLCGTLEKQAAVLFYEMIKLHPFQNGNKRIATVSLIVFLALNEKWLKTGWRELYYIAVTVANSIPQHHEGVVRLLEEFIRNNSFALEKTR